MSRRRLNLRRFLNLLISYQSRQKWRRRLLRASILKMKYCILWRFIKPKMKRNKHLQMKILFTLKKLLNLKNRYSTKRVSTLKKSLSNSWNPINPRTKTHPQKKRKRKSQRKNAQSTKWCETKTGKRFSKIFSSKNRKN